MAENEIAPRALGVAWDGTGYGPTTLWGGSSCWSRRSFERLALFATVPTARRRGCHQTTHAQPLAFSSKSGETRLGNVSTSHRCGRFPRTNFTHSQDAEPGLNAPVTSSAGRLFDAIAALSTSVSGSASKDRPRWSSNSRSKTPRRPRTYPFEFRHGVPLTVDWRPTIDAMVSDIARNDPTASISAKFHNMLAEVVRTIALRVGEARVVLTGGCFQNRYLTDACLQRLIDAGFRPYWHQRVPPNDGGISLGQVIAAAATTRSAVAENHLATT